MVPVQFSTFVQNTATDSNSSARNRGETDRQEARAAFQKRHSRSLVVGIAYAIVSELQWVVDAIMGWV